MRLFGYLKMDCSRYGQHVNNQILFMKTASAFLQQMR